MKFTPNRRGFEELLRSEEVKKDLRRRSERVADAALSGYTAAPGERNPGYVANVQQGKSRARGSVVTATPHAARSSAVNNTLLRALEAARG